MNRVSPTIGAVSFSRILAETAAGPSPPDPAAWSRGGGRVCYHLTILAAGRVQQAPSAGASSDYLDPSPEAATVDKSATMLDAARRVEDAVRSATALSPGELKRLRREAAWSVHPDLFAGPDKQLAEELMKSVNVLVAAALDDRT